MRQISKKEKQSITIIFKEDDNGKMIAYIGEMNFTCKAVDIAIINNAISKVAEILDNIKINQE